MAISEQQQQLNMEKFKAAQARAKKLIQSDARQEIAEGKKPKYIPTIKESMGGSYGSSSVGSYDDYDNEPNYLNEEQMANIHNKTKTMPINTNNGVRNNKVPSAILKEFANNPIDTSSLESGLGMESQSSVLDVMGIKPQQRRVVQEEKVEPQTNLNVSSNVNVDYSLIKTIVEDCMRKMLPTLKKSLINESKVNDDSISLLKFDKSFKFVTKNGDIYEATLIKKGNLNDMK